MSMPRIIDLTVTLEHGMRGVDIEQTMTLERDGWNARIYRLYSHAGTHMDAPAANRIATAGAPGIISRTR